jgi:hypothetical protein
MRANSNNRVPQMERRKPGKNNLEVSAIGLGCMGLNGLNASSAVLEMTFFPESFKNKVAREIYKFESEA